MEREKVEGATADQHRGRPFILDETAPDESFLIGTRDQLRGFAEAILDLIAGENQARTGHDVEVALAALETALTDPLAEIVLGGVAVVASEADRQALINAIRKNSGDPAINWKGQHGASGSCGLHSATHLDLPTSHLTHPRDRVVHVGARR